MRAFILFLAAFFILLSSIGAFAGSSEEAAAAFNRGDYKTAFKSFKLLAEQGDAKAQQVLSSMYRHGDGVKQDSAQAMYWLRQSANRGLPYAQWQMGQMYETGEDVPKDYVEAAFWYTLAVKFDQPPILGIGAILARDDAMSHLTDEQRVEVENRIEVWKPTPSLNRPEEITLPNPAKP